MEKLLYQEKNIGSARKIMMGICAAIFLLVGVVILFASSQVGEYASGAKTALIVIGFLCLIYVAYCVAAIIAMNKSEIKVYDGHVEGWQYNIVIAKNYYAQYKQITGIQLNNSVVTIYAQGKEYGHKSKNAQKIYNLLMEQWQKNA